MAGLNAAWWHLWLAVIPNVSTRGWLSYLNCAVGGLPNRPPHVLIVAG